MIVYENSKELESRLNAYFEYCDELGKPYTKTGLARFTGIGSGNFNYYLNHNDVSMQHAMREGLDRIIEQVEERGLEGQTSPAFATFWLTNADKENWQNKQQIEQKTFNMSNLLDVIDGNAKEKQPVQIDEPKKQLTETNESA